MFGKRHMSGKTHLDHRITRTPLGSCCHSHRESERCQRKLELANRLITALASEGERWASTVEQLRKVRRGDSKQWRLAGACSWSHKGLCCSSDVCIVTGDVINTFGCDLCAGL
jgi:hypothetical protein